MSEHWADQQNESGMDAGERHHFDEHDSPWDAHCAPVPFICHNCGHTFMDDEMDGAECPECGSDDYEEMEE